MTLNFDLLNPKKYRFLSFFVLQLCMKDITGFKLCKLKTVSVIALQQSVAEYISMTLTFDLLTPKSIGVLFLLSSTCVWSIKSVDSRLFE